MRKIKWDGGPAEKYDPNADEPFDWRDLPSIILLLAVVGMFLLMIWSFTSR